MCPASATADPTISVGRREDVIVRKGLGFFLLLLVRGHLLWIALPLATLMWVLRGPYAIVRRRPLKLGAMLGWVDLNLIAILTRSILRPFAREPVRFIPWKEVTAVDHRPGLLDLA